jgi:hypothetical protein
MGGCACVRKGRLAPLHVLEAAVQLGELLGEGVAVGLQLAHTQDRALEHDGLADAPLGGARHDPLQPVEALVDQHAPPLLAINMVQPLVLGLFMLRPAPRPGQLLYLQVHGWTRTTHMLASTSSSRSSVPSSCRLPSLLSEKPRSWPDPDEGAAGCTCTVSVGVGGAGMQARRAGVAHRGR